jgi:magnesium transporter
METPGLAELPRHIADRARMIWVDLEDPSDEEIGVLGGIFGFHVLAVEDCIRSDLLPKVNAYDGYAYAVFHAPDVDDDTGRLGTQKVDLFIGSNYLVTHHPSHVKGIFDSRGQVAKSPGSLLRSPDWLLHGILDVVTDTFAPLLERMRDQVETSRDGLLANPRSEDFGRLLDLRRTVYSTRHVLSLQREVLQAMAFGDPAWVTSENQFYFRDLCDRTKVFVQATETCREDLKGAVEAHLCHTSRQTSTASRTIAVLAALALPLLLAALALPLLLSASIYLMRHGGLPGSGSPVAHWAVLGGSALAALALLIYLIRKRWV